MTKMKTYETSNDKTGNDTLHLIQRLQNPEDGFREILFKPIGYRTDWLPDEL
jgi:hypothetical protein